MNINTINEVTENLMLLANEMEKNLYEQGKGYLNGSVRVVKLLLNNLKYINCEYDKRVNLDFCAEMLRRLGKEQYNGVKETYFTFDSMGDN